MRIKQAFTALLLLAAPTQAGASGLWTAKDLREYCRPYVRDQNANDAFDAAACGGYISGVLDMINASPSSDLKDGITVGQVAEMFVKYVNEHPEDLEINASFELTRILIQNGKLIVKK